MTNQFKKIPLIHSTFLLFFVLLDQIFKYLARNFLNDSITVIPNFIDLIHVQNKGISFSWLSDLPEEIRYPILSIGTLVILIGISFYIFRYWLEFHHLEQWGYNLVLSGAIGNFIDRVFLRGVTDYMHFRFFENSFFINNFADDLISIGFIFVLLGNYFNTKKK